MTKIQDFYKTKDGVDFHELLPVSWLALSMSSSSSASPSYTASTYCPIFRELHVKADNPGLMMSSR